MIIGVDPGASGGLAMLSDSGEFVGGLRMPLVKVTPKRKVVDLSAINAWIFDTRGGGMGGIIRRIVIEQVSAMPRQGVSSTFSFGLATGAIEAWAVDQPGAVDWVTPAVWKKALHLSSEKQASFDKARLAFGDHPLWQVKANEGIVEAALIALYWQRYRS